MPYVPSEKTDGKSQDRNLLDVAIELVASDIALEATSNFELIRQYKYTFITLGQQLEILITGKNIDNYVVPSTAVTDLARQIYALDRTYRYDGAFLGELNYSVTRIIQRVPHIKYDKNSELRYWLYAGTTQALIYAANYFIQSALGIGGVFEDIKDEYKRRVNTAYEAAQIAKSGDCYDTPYYTRLVEIVDEYEAHCGYQEVMLKRSEDTMNKDIIGQMVIHR